MLFNIFVKKKNRVEMIFFGIEFILFCYIFIIIGCRKFKKCLINVFRKDYYILIYS